MNTVLMVLKNCYADWEAAYLAAGIQELGGEGFQLKTVSWSSDPVVSMGDFMCVRIIPLTAVRRILQESF